LVRRHRGSGRRSRGSGRRRLPRGGPGAAAAPAKAKKEKSSASAASAPAAAAPGGVAGMVWVNSGSNVYHCQGDKWYGKTKHGEYMTEAAAKSKGARPDHGKACQ
jgi:hypothetical protein